MNDAGELTMSDPAGFSLSDPLVVGFGITGQAVVRALLARGHRVTVIDDRPSSASVEVAADLGVDLVVAPDQAEVVRQVNQASILLPSPGVPDHHPVFCRGQARLRPNGQ